MKSNVSHTRWQAGSESANGMPREETVSLRLHPRRAGLAGVVNRTVPRRFYGKAKNPDKWVAETAFVIIGGSFGFFCDKETLQPQQQ